MTERVHRHGVRRAAELREVAGMLEDLGPSGSLARAVADAHERVAGGQSLAGGHAAHPPNASKRRP
jgi:hypothetical protein